MAKNPISWTSMVFEADLFGMSSGNRQKKDFDKPNVSKCHGPINVNFNFLPLTLTLSSCQYG
uniref:Uncharacterized protein n=1 Tax=Anguilla anguilla TaxID=7936 RepID=A0A0E9Q2N2_ANGAN